MTRINLDEHITTAKDRITEQEKQYMQKQLTKETSEAKKELSQYKSTIMVERRDANYDVLKLSIPQMEDAIGRSGNNEAISALEGYKRQFVHNNKKTGYVDKGRSYVIALYQTLLYIKAKPADRNLLGSYGGCKCGVDGIFGLDTLMLSAKVLRTADQDFHGVVNDATFAYLTNINGSLEGKTDAPDVLKNSFPGKKFNKGNISLSADRLIFDATGKNTSQTLVTKDPAFIDTMQDRKVGEIGSQITLMQHNDVWYVRDGSKGDISGYYPVKVEAGNIVVDEKGVPVIKQTPLEQTPLEQTPLEQTPLEQTPLEQTPLEQTTGTAERTNLLNEVALFAEEASALVVAGNTLRDQGNLSGVVDEYKKAIEKYMQALQKIEAHNKTYPQNTIDTGEMAGFKSGLEGDIQRYQVQIEQQARDQQKQERENRAAEEKKHAERAKRASDAQFDGLLSYDQEKEVFHVAISSGTRDIGAENLATLQVLQKKVIDDAPSFYGDFFANIAEEKRKEIHNQIVGDELLIDTRNSQSDIAAFDRGFATRTKYQQADYTSIVDEMKNYNLLGAGFLGEEIDTYTAQIKKADIKDSDVKGIDSKIDQQAQALIGANTEIVYDADTNRFTVKGVTLPRAEVMSSSSSIDDILHKANFQLIQGTSVRYDLDNSQFEYKGSKKPSASINSVDDFTQWVNDIDTQVNTQRNALNLNEGSQDLQAIESQINSQNMSIQNEEDKFKLVNKNSEDGSSKTSKKKLTSTRKTPEREIRYSSLLEPNIVPLKAYMTVDGIVDVVLLHKEVRTQIEHVFNQKSDADKNRLKNVYGAIGGMETSL